MEPLQQGVHGAQHLTERKSEQVRAHGVTQCQGPHVGGAAAVTAVTARPGEAVTQACTARR